MNKRVTTAVIVLAAFFILSIGAQAQSGCTADVCVGDSWQAAYIAATPGTVLTLEAGLHPAQTFTFDPTKTSPADVVFRAAPGAAVTVSGDLTSGSTLGSDGAQHLTIRDVKVNGTLVSRPGSQDLTFERIDAGQLNISGGNGISVLGGDYGPLVDVVSHVKQGAQNVLISGAVFHDFTISDPAKHAECLMIWGAATRVTIRNSIFRNCTDFNLFVKSENASGIVIERSYFDQPMPGEVATVSCNPNCSRAGNSIRFSTYSYPDSVVRDNIVNGGISVTSGVTVLNNQPGPIPPVPPALAVSNSYEPSSQLAGCNCYFSALAASGDTLHAVWRQSGSIRYSRSLDQGGVWSPAVVLAGADEIPLTEPLLAEGQNLYLLFERGDDLYLKRSTDGGANWGADVLFASGLPAHFWRVSLSANGQSIHAAWTSHDDIADTTSEGMFYRRSLDGGATWAPVVELAPSNLEPGRPALSASGNTLHLAWIDQRDGQAPCFTFAACPEVYYRRSLDNGMTWGAERRITQAPGNTVGRPDVQAAANGSISLLWQDDEDQNGMEEVWAAYSADEGVTWSAPTRVSMTNVQHEHPMSAGNPASPWVAAGWYGIPGGNAIFASLSADGGQTWEPQEQVTTSGNCAVPRVATTSGYAHLLYLCDGNSLRVSRRAFPSAPPPPSDTTPPVLVLPADITVEAPDLLGALVVYTISVSDDIDPAPSVACAPASGSLFPIGVAQVLCAAQDAAGNMSQGTFLVTVLAPVDDPPSSPGALAVAAYTQRTVTISWPGATDDVGIAGYRLYLDGTYLSTAGPLARQAKFGVTWGEHTITVETVDSAGQRASSAIRVKGIWKEV